jgi:hypothetical protein
MYSLERLRVRPPHRIGLFHHEFSLFAKTLAHYCLFVKTKRSNHRGPLRLAFLLSRTNFGLLGLLSPRLPKARYRFLTVHYEYTVPTPLRPLPVGGVRRLRVRGGSCGGRCRLGRGGGMVGKSGKYPGGGKGHRRALRKSGSVDEEAEILAMGSR